MNLSRRLLVALASLLLLMSVMPTLTAAPAAAAPVAPVSAPAALPKKSIWGEITCSIAFGPSAGSALRGESACSPAKRLVNKGKEEIVKALQSTIVKPVADGMKDFTSDTLRETLTFWLLTKSVQVKDSGLVEMKRPECKKPEKKDKDKDKDKDKAPDPRCKDGNKKSEYNSITLQAILFGIGVMIATLLTIIQGIRTAIRRKGTPLLEALQGLMVAVLACGIGVVVIDSLLVASDVLTEEILDVGFNGKENATDVIVASLLPTMQNPMAVILMAMIVLLVGLVQVVLLFLRQAAIPIQAVILPIAASGQVGGATTRQWLPRLATAILTIIAYKPLAAVIISVGFIEMANAPTMVDWIRGVVTLLLSIFALKSLMGVFAPIGASIAGGGGSGMLGSLLSAASSFLGARSGSGGGSSAPTDPVKFANRDHGGGPPTAGGPPSAGDGGAAVQHSQSNDKPEPPGEGGASGGPGTPPGQPGAPGAAGAEGAAAGAAKSGTSSGKAAAGGPVGIAIIAAETAHKGVQSAGDTVGGKK
ncbi:hypothetical protein [Streptomyces triculaminicus]|uniref:hypothetical protein n=1 Tax=Streptomyces triculaminicus TaxID=2816232 RepID=UPI0037BCADAC